MIPLKLELSNFLSYRETAVLDFDAIHTACISGANGAGKSSILDAITWALFGKSRVKSDDDLVNKLSVLDGDGAEVKLTFALEEVVYRIIRRKRHNKRLVLELQMETGADNWKSLSESKTRETQTAVETLLRMNYDTFINASFLLQGQADEFTTKTSSKRKEILADLLGVNVWDNYKEAATTRRKRVEGQLALLEGSLREIETELGEEGERKTLLEVAQTESAAIQEKLALKEQVLQQARQLATAVQQQKESIENVSQSLSREERKLADLQRQQTRRQEQRAGYETILAEAETIEQAFAAWQKAEAELKAWREKEGKVNRLQREMQPHQLKISQTEARLKQELMQLQKQAAQVADAEGEREAVQTKQAKGQNSVAQLLADLAKIEKQEQTYHAAKSALQALESERRLWQQELSQLQAQGRQIEAFKREQQSVTKRQQGATAMLQELNGKLTAVQSQQLRLEKAKLERSDLDKKQPLLKEEMDKLKTRIDQLTVQEGGACPLCGQPLSRDHQQEVVADLTAEGKQNADEYRGNRQKLSDLTAELGRLETAVKTRPHLERDQQKQTTQLAKAEARLAEIDRAVAEWSAGHSGTASNEARLAELEKLVLDESAILVQKEKMVELETAVAQKSDLEKQRQQSQRAVAEATARLTEIERLTGKWEAEGKAQLSVVEKNLERGAWEAEARGALAELEKSALEIGYDGAAHEDTKSRRDALGEASERQQALGQARAAVLPLDEALADGTTQIGEQEKSVATLGEQKETAVAQLATLEADSGDLYALEDEVNDLREAKSVAERKVGGAQSRLTVLDDLRERQTNYATEQTDLKLQIQRLKLLEKACGRDGVQALLIEQAVPDIEDSANRLLDQLTDGEMQVRFLTQKKLKSSDRIAETLDIQISDRSGERPYENFSGGEQFRVNFAIRLALSQILAKRSGARLQTLVIDEGFGSQDPNGRQRLVEAIHAIQDDFVRILVITHIDELRDAFPTRIEVEKRPSGSIISIN